MFEYIKNLKPYFYSLREFESNVIFDLKLPINWEIGKILSSYKSIKYKIQDKNDKVVLLSIFTLSSKDGYEVILAAVKDVIKKNKEEEEKQRLFEEKIKQLKLLFESKSLDDLKEINFIKEREENEQEYFEDRNEDVEQGVGEIESGDREPQNEND